ncbi:hypothetical protein IHV25_09045 [Phaeovibrio sulfidiphilus]|uniref:Transmembrane protein n=1 Tax=Phaeovibrio sulfidiphilus TaxID=1220600 RepID=A0A8J6YJX7_9PROT|nr:hypothetical protein [Phaeovibrio sulfidiphilus]MBE1237791.1 hypothetical protein [Phaeovibrio sulfidiphilus]
MKKAPASKTKTRAANAPQNPSVKAPAPKPAEPAKDLAKDAVKKVEASAARTVADVEKKAENALEQVAVKLDSAAEEMLSGMGLADRLKAPKTEAEKRRMMLIAYGLYALTCIFFLPTIAAYFFIVRRFKGAMKGGIWESHIVWLERTFLFGFGGFVVGLVVFPWFGWLIPIAAGLYVYYRVVKAYLNYDESKPIENPTAYY